MMKKIGTLKYLNDERGPIPIITVGGVRLPITEFKYEIEMNGLGLISITMPASQFEMEGEENGKS